VRDNGIGIAPEMRDHIFDLFGGSVQVHSAGIGQGSTFEVRLPLLPEEHVKKAGVPPEAEPQPTPQAPARRVLVVDDDEDVANVLVSLLRRWGHDAHVVYDGPAALEAAAALRPEVVLMDLGMPGMDGYEVARRLRQRPEFARVPLVALSGYGQAEDKRRSQEAGFDIHLVKPFGGAALEELMARIATRPA
jgi:CheY-like chemotaxis protein